MQPINRVSKNTETTGMGESGRLCFLAWACTGFKLSISHSTKWNVNHRGGNAEATACKPQDQGLSGTWNLNTFKAEGGGGIGGENYQ